MSIHDAAFTRHCPLNETELEVVSWLSKGKSMVEIGEIMQCHRNTVMRRVNRVYTKVGGYNWHGLVGTAFRNGWLQ